MASPIPPRSGGPTGYELYLRLTVHPEGFTTLRLKRWGSHRDRAADWPGDGWLKGGRERAAEVLALLLERMTAKAAKTASPGRKGIPPLVLAGRRSHRAPAGRSASRELLSLAYALAACLISAPVTVGVLDTRPLQGRGRA